MITKTVETIKFKFAHQRELIFQTMISFICRVLAAVAAFFASLVIGRQLGAEGAGLYFLAFSVVSFLSAFARLGLENTIVRFVGAAFPDNDWLAIKSIFYKSAFLVLLCSTPIALCLYYFSDYLANEVFDKKEVSTVLKMMAPGIVGLALLTIISMALQGVRRVIPSVIILTILVNLLLMGGLLLFPIESSQVTALIYSMSTFITVIVGLYLLLSKVGHGSDAGQVVGWADIFKSCMPLWIVVIMQQTIQWSGQFIAGAYVDAEHIAQLAVAQRTALLVSFILTAVNIVVSPRFAAMYKRSEMIALEKLAITSTRMMIGFSVPIVAIMVIFPEYVMALFGEGFSDGAHLLQILAVGQFVSVMTGSVAFLLMMSGHEKELRNTTLISGPVALGLCFLLIPLYGATGAAIATAIAIASQNLIAVWWVRRRLGFNTLAIWR